MLCLLLCAAHGYSQTAPDAANRPWKVPQSTQLKLPPPPGPVASPDPAKVYTLAELIDFAESNNPETRVAWQNAKARAADLGVTKAELYPTMAATVLAQSVRDNIFFGTAYYRQTTYTFAPTFLLDYTIFDFGRRNEDISIGKSNLLAANFAFNDTHRKVIFNVMQAYYRLLNYKGQEGAAEANLNNARTVRQAAEARLQNGLATLPDVLEARSAEAQADYDLQAAIGATEIAQGDLANALGVSPLNKFQVQSIQDLTLPQEIPDTVEKSIDRALSQRPDLMQRLAELRATKTGVKREKSEYWPTLNVNGNAGLSHTYGIQNQLPGLWSPNQEFWTAKLSLNWTIFDGFARENRIARAQADQKEAAAAAKAAQDQVENDVWTAYSNAQTALREQRAAAAFLASANESYNAALESYNYGVRTQIDVVSAQRVLAQARTSDISARTQLLTGVAALAYETADLLYGKGP